MGHIPTQAQIKHDAFDSLFKAVFLSDIPFDDLKISNKDKEITLISKNVKVTTVQDKYPHCITIENTTLKMDSAEVVKFFEVLLR